MGLIGNLGSNEDAQETFLAVGLIQNLDEVRYAELKICMHKSYVNGKDRWTKTLSSALNVLLNWKWGKRPTEH